MSYPLPPLALEKAVEAARAAGLRQKEALGSEKAVDLATDHDVKLRLDCECQEQITAMLLAAFPDHSVFGEEGGSEYGVTEWQWIVDPIDGTVNFFHNFPHFCAAIALQHKGESVLAVTYDPNRDEVFTAVKGGGAFVNGKRLAASDRATLKEAMVSTGFSKGKNVVDESIALVTFYGLNAQKLRMNGSAALDLAYVAAGRLDIYLERSIRLWDVAGGVLLVREAGGAIELEPYGTEPHTFTLIASNGKVPPKRWGE
ncbi:myo-inositol-1(or 4)-monophosphatase [Verrucomicrobium sp. GAS474]|uniref:inositol monophosphatase family protein n=1 Tax=Verrucomicrobium sp. GAS474 TaxID=1882831 RepID=UPI00087CD1FA|nr:inositol monophosphatase family protein [Verrucomicrobium sp. GAS474]SDU08181.1 myo-inositol-1(or 4)-monophosphatase [Verrucomicrobium sp. GAS474]